ncbi:L-asparaginase 2-1 [Purpureocillium lavendulum]|uniref:L-asparaginase 2-1 n=1 Tax=Purpureocillium lavendulum TaxID=1247861 RepID=A0AB34G3B9_9HYPO|nr:L-asparaginase 2-1 [Purpureocillium lavendulum]
MFQPHPEEHLHLRLHRARSVVLTSEELVEIRAAQRTFEGAYMRTALGQFSFSLVVLKIFTEEFYAIGALFAAYGVAVLLVAVHRRYQGQRQFFTAEDDDGVVRRRFKTSGDTVVLMTALSLAAYATLLVLTWTLV